LLPFCFFFAVKAATAKAHMKSRRLSAAAVIVAVIFYLCLGFKVWAQKLKKGEKEFPRIFLL
jgi:hypothetical protein